MQAASFEDVRPEPMAHWTRLTFGSCVWGNTRLADQYEAAFADLQRMLLTAASSDTSDDAAEQFQRVQAEAFAWLHRRLDDDHT